MSRFRYRRRSVPVPPAAVAAAVVAVAFAGMIGGHGTGAHLTAASGNGTTASSAGADAAIAYARAQLGKPYVWGGTGPDGFDCSGLVMMAYQSAGISIPRTSQDQWAALPHVPSSQPGDLVFFPGSDGTWTAPGHVALVISSTQMIQAYATGTPIEVSPLSGDGAGGIVGYARPS
jgi:peptidoglycan DL-endopeptidase CwlO